ncbi:MAG: 3-dehydroquinate synthase [Phycisphaerales bacterium]|nr:MAG: 3-dehydroquinate synthase [Phycisphaerales bacterium]
MTSTTSGSGDHRVRVPLGDRAYDVLVGDGLLDRLGELTASSLGHAPARACVVADLGVPEATVIRATASLHGSGAGVTVFRLEPSERVKNLATLEHLLRELAHSRHERTDPVIALGGGVVGDLAGFAAGVYRRGCPVIQCPTTLLSMVDASVGGKTGVNLAAAALPGQEHEHHHRHTRRYEHDPAHEADTLGLLKNFIGVFHQPSLVLADVGVLASLPERDLRAGLAECVKHTLIAASAAPPEHDSGDPPEALAARIERGLAGVLARDPSACASMVADNVRLKARVVAGDERELASSAAGGRALLNLGHTFAHAIEPRSALSPTDNPADAPLRHGEAVAIGCVAAAATSAAMGFADAGFVERVRELFETAGLATRIGGLPSNEVLIRAMGHDKKVSGGRLRLVLPEPGAQARVVEAPPSEAIDAGWSAVRLG